MALEDLGIDARVAAVLASQGIANLYPPQQEAWAAIRKGRNTLVAIPTASGKSLVAYLAILHRWLATGKKSLYIVPLRALASEKHEELESFKSLGLKVGIATGDLDERDPRLGRFDVIVCTSEKADALLRHRTSWVQDIGCVVVDELHLLNDSGRGPTLEVILARFRALVPGAQVVGLSATVHNAAELAKWLDADLVTSEWRPVQLHVGTYAGDRLEFLGQKARVLPAGGDPVASLVEDTIKSGGQCLVFVSTRKSAESQAQKLGGVVRDLLKPDDLQKLADALGPLDDAGEGSPTAKKLKLLCAAGVSFHTAGLDSGQRRFIEGAFRKGLLKVLCATPTLAAGVNTPARRVIIRDLTRFDAGEGNRPLPVMEVKQMMGRAGRPRYDPFGEAVLVVKTEEQRDMVVEAYLHGDPEPVTSKLGAEGPLRTHVLSSIAGGYCDSVSTLQLFFARTFWAKETDEYVVQDRIEDVLAFLQDNAFVVAKGARLEASPFGRRTSDLYIDPLSALRLKEALVGRATATTPATGGDFETADKVAARAQAATNARKPTPFALLQAVAGCPDLFPLYLKQADDWVQERFFRHHEELLVAADGRDLEAAMAYGKTAFLLMDWMAEIHLDTLEERYGIGPGDIRMRLDSAAWLLHAMHELARTFRQDWVQPIADLILRLEHGVKEELLPLIRLKGIGRVRARTLYGAGFHSVAKLRGVPVERIAALPGFGVALATQVLKQVGDDPGAIPEPPTPTPKDAAGQSSLARFGGRP